MTGADRGIDALRQEIDEVERHALHGIDPGLKAVAIAIGVMGVLVTMPLPWVRDIEGWRVLIGQMPGVDSVSVVMRLFSGLAILVCVLGSAVTLLVGRWSLALVCALGGSLATVLGVLSIWSTQTGPGRLPGPGPGVGLVVAVIAVLVITVLWLRTAFSRSL